MTPKEERLANDCRQAKKLLGESTQATWITFPIIKAEGKDNGQRE